LFVHRLSSDNDVFVEFLPTSILLRISSWRP
jgi:hypothetical protein